MARIRILVADGHRIFAEALATALAAEPDVDVAAAGSAQAAERALERAVAENRPFQVLLVDADLASGHPPALPRAVGAPSGGAPQAGAPHGAGPHTGGPDGAAPNPGGPGTGAQRSAAPHPAASSAAGPDTGAPPGSAPRRALPPAQRAPVALPAQRRSSAAPPPALPAAAPVPAPQARPASGLSALPALAAAVPAPVGRVPVPRAGGPTGQDGAGQAGQTGPAVSEGIALVARVRAAHPGLQAVVLSAADDPRRVVQALQAGATGWVAKESSLGRLMAVVRGVLRDETHIPPLLLTGVVRELTAARRDRTESERLVESLTPREKQVLRCMVAGLGRQAVADRLYLSPHTVRTHMQNVLGKLGVHSTLAAVAVARRAGVGPAE